MKNFDFFVILMLMIVSFLVFGCGRFNRSDSSADGTFPATIGSFRREMAYKEKETNYLNEKNKNQKYKTSDAKYNDGKDDIFYGISNHQTADDAINEQSKEATHGNNSVWKTIDLKDKSGANVGKITICRVNDYSANSDSSVSGGFNYSLAFNVNNQNHHAYVYAPSNTTTQEQTDKLVAFVKALPAASQVDLSVLDMITTSFAGKGITADKLSAISPPVKLASAPYLKGKTAVISTGALSDGVVTELYIKESDRQANLMEEVGSVVKIECAKGASIGQYVVKEKGTKIPAFSSVCKVSVIDNSIPAVIAQKSFTNSVMVDNYMVETDKKGGLKDYEKEYVSYAPTDQITEFLKKLPRK
jgi:Sec-independent protein translocase protein TatA